MHESDAPLPNHVRKFLEEQRASRLLLEKKRTEALGIIERADRKSLDNDESMEREPGQTYIGINLFQ